MGNIGSVTSLLWVLVVFSLNEGFGPDGFQAEQCNESKFQVNSMSWMSKPWGIRENRGMAGSGQGFCLRASLPSQVCPSLPDFPDRAGVARGLLGISLHSPVPKWTPGRLGEGGGCQFKAGLIWSRTWIGFQLPSFWQFAEKLKRFL